MTLFRSTWFFFPRLYWSHLSAPASYFNAFSVWVVCWYIYSVMTPEHCVCVWTTFGPPLLLSPPHASSLGWFLSDLDRWFLSAFWLWTENRTSAQLATLVPWKQQVHAAGKLTRSWDPGLLRHRSATCIEFTSGPTPLSLAQSLSLPAQLRQSFKRDGQQLSWVLPQQRSCCHTNERIQFNGINKLYYTFKSDQICMYIQRVTSETFNFSPFLALWSKKGSLKQWCYQRIREQALMKWIRRTSDSCTKN